MHKRLPQTLAAFLAVAVGASASAGTVTVPAGSNLSVAQREDPSLIEHMPLQNLITWEIVIRHGICSGGGTCLGGTQSGQACTMDADCPAPPLTITGGTVQFYDRAGNPIDDPVLGPLTITPTLVEQVAVERATPTNPSGPPPPITLGPDGAVLPPGSNVFLPFPFEKVSHNFVPASVDMTLCFKEYEGPGGTCPDPLEVKGVTLVEYRVPAGQTYIYPLKNPVLNPGGVLFTGSGGGHEIGDNHRQAGNQRYAYDVGVLVGGTDCVDGCDANPDFFIYTEPVYAVSDGVVVVAEKDHPENPAPGTVLADAGLPCQSQRCDGASPACDPGTFPGSGNQIVLIHGNGEFTTMAHMTTGSNSFLSCDDSVLQGWQIGNVGNVGTSGAPHLHYSSLNTPSPEDGGALSFPMYFNNVQFPTAGYEPKRQLDVAMLSGTQWTVLAPPSPLPANAALGGPNEVEPNDSLAAHNAVALPATVVGTAEAGDVGEMAVRGDGIEDVYRVDLSGADSVRFELVPNGPGQNLDLYVVTEDLRVLNETHQGTARTGPERVCLELPAGPYYAFVTNVDGPGKTADAPYSFSAASDPQTIACALTNPAVPIPVDGVCAATVAFTLSLHDNCCLDPDTLDLKVTAVNPTGNATLGPVQLDAPVVVGPRDITVTGRVAVSGLTSCPAVVQVSATARDCSGNTVSTVAQGTSCTAPVVDLLPPTLESSLATTTLWPPDHHLLDVGQVNQIADNCDAGVAASLEQKAWSDEPEAGEPGSGPHAPDADLAGSLRLRRERAGPGDGRVYLVTGTVADACGNPAFSCVAAGVPHAGGTGAQMSLTAQAAAAEAACLANQGAPPVDFLAVGLGAPVGPKQ